MTPSATDAAVVQEVEEPIRAELFSIERLEQHAESLAAAQLVTDDRRAGRPLIPRAAENGRLLLEYYRSIALAVQQEHTITPAAEWFVDNFFIVEEQLREIRDDLPASYYRELPKLAPGHLEGYPRVYGIAWAFIAHTDSRLDPEALRRFVNAYQRVQQLTIGELWAIAITLRIVLVENLRRVAELIVHSRAGRREADQLADRLLGTGANPAVDPQTVLREFEKKPLQRSFAVQLVQRLRDLDPKVGPILRWLDERLAAQGTTADDIVRSEHQKQAATTVTVRNIITSMRLTSAWDWRAFFESTSPVDAILRHGSAFAEMDFTTRDSYRHAIEDLARGSKRPETEIARKAVERARGAAAEGTNHSRDSADVVRRSDPGFYLISRGRRAFEREVGFRVPWRRSLLRLYVRFAAPGYLGSIAILTAIVLAFPLIRAHQLGASTALLVLFGVLAAIPASDLAISLINRAVTDLFDPRTLPRLELKGGVPEHLRTMVVVPTLLSSVEDVKEQVARLEIHYLGNSEGDLRFALLTDWVDAPAEMMPGDDDLVAAAAEAIAGLNARHGPAPGGGERFLLFHRKRVWNESQQKWMGWERKRGKLEELNQFLRGGTETTFVPIAGRPPQAVPGARYVVTLDADTRVPRDGVASLVGTMAHPLNRPAFSSTEGRIVNGYGLVQPRVNHTLPGEGGGSAFQKIFAGPAGIDPYASAVSDVYQDLFHEGSFTGKGIYDIDAFNAALGGRVEENTLLSHDLLEGVFVRCALATDIELFEEYPSHYESAAARQHRWVRGDWQLLPWILGFGGRSKDGRPPQRMPAVGRWKMIDNLRRSLSAPCMFLTMLLGWLVPDVSPWVWTRFILATIAVPPLLPFLAGIIPRPGGISKRTYIRGVLSDASLGASQIGLSVTFLAYQAWLMSDAILRTLARLLVTRRNLLEWVTAAHAKQRLDLDIAHMYRRMGGTVALAFAGFVIVAIGNQHALPVALPFLLLWAASPVVARTISLPPPPSSEKALSPADALALRSFSRLTWRFFETFVRDTDHWLPPDNFQEDPNPVVAHRTSPTNMGLALLTVLSAHDLGWIGTWEAVERLESTLATLRRLEQFRGHFYNWYSTSDLRPLDPKYISSVDSGNLAGDLIAVANGCRKLIHESLGGNKMRAGTEDAIRLLREALAGVSDAQRTSAVTRKQINDAAEELAGCLELAPFSAAGWARLFAEASDRANTLADMAQAFAQERGDALSSGIRTWADAARSCIESHSRDAETLLPWTRLKSMRVLNMTRQSVEQAPEWAALQSLFPSAPALVDAPERLRAAIGELERLRARLLDNPSMNSDVLERVDLLTRALSGASTEATALIDRLEAIAKTAESMSDAMDFTFLFDRTRKLLSIGYRVAEGILDEACYDLLASEARLASFVGIAKGDLPVEHWFHLTRALTPVGRGSALVSWSGSMFEYLMPALLMKSPEGSLLSQTYDLVVHRQIEYGEERGVPWGISESAFSARDIDLTYQYSAFGVPGLGLKRGLIQDLVIAPYATALASMVDPSAAVRDLLRMAAVGARGHYGFYESLDYTRSRLPEGQSVVVVRTYMAHHQGMSLVSFANALTDGAMRERFHAEPSVKASELLLQERTPREVLVARPRAEEVSAAANVRELVPPVVREFDTPNDLVPRTQLLSNARYSIMLTSAGSGYSRWQDIAVTRWREDATLDNWGTYIFLRDEQSGYIWSAGYQPVCAEPDDYSVSFYEDRAEFTRHDRSMKTTLEVVVSSEDDAEVRRVSLTNLGSRARDVQVTSYAEIALIAQAADVAHPAFANLFVETEFVPDLGALIATRRKRSPDDASVFAAHTVVVEGEAVGDLQYETDRARFLGRGRSIREPFAVMDGLPLSRTTGSVLDPIMSLRRTVHIPAGSTVRLTFATIVAATREQALDIADKFRDASVFERTQTLAWTHAQVQLHHLGIDPEEAHLFQRLANAVLYSDSALRASSETLNSTLLDISTLWGQGISGDLPIVLVRIDDPDDIDIVRQLLRAHEYWRNKNLSVDIVILNEKASSYIQELQGSLEALIRTSQHRLSPSSSSVSGKIFLLRTDLIAGDVREQLQCIARVVLFSRRGPLSDQVARAHLRPLAPPPAAKPAHSGKRMDVPLPRESLLYFNGLGGFAPQGREYVITLAEGLRTPEPWINVIANPSFGFLVSQSGAGFTWSLNSHENQLTPWSNDHVTEAPGEAIYLRDEATGEIWSPTALPIRDEAATYVARHGQGYSRFQHGSHGILADLVQFVPTDDPVKVSRLILQNDSGRARRISVTAYAEWVLGSSRYATAPHIISEVDPQSRALLARSAWKGEFGGRIAFADLGGKQTSHTCDRREFLGRNGSAAYPAALAHGGPLSGNVGPALDPCAALQTSIELRPGARAEVRFVLGQGESREHARQLIGRYRAANPDEVLAAAADSWNNVLCGVQVETPEPEMDLLLNRWLLYQALSCRVWGRAAFYQLSGAYGFRDQLQDVMALTVTRRDVARDQILRAASRQFIEGDVQHWWHPPSGRGIRTRMSDDLLWLPYAVSYWVETTDDMAILDESVPFIEGDTLAEGQNESYFEPRVSQTRASIFEHCARAIDRSLAVGRHGLPLIGTGDWNDGMNRVGVRGQGESVWLGWFLHNVLSKFARIADTRREHQRAETWRLHASALKVALEREGWDGEWYRRAFFDDGTPLGAAQSPECKIDSIAQSWGVISGAAEPGRATRAMAAVDRQLVMRPDGVVRLLAPPFDKAPFDPGYIKGYVPGIRENGGQYTHAAVWSVIAFAALGDGDRAGELFRMLNPIRRASTRAGVQRYKVEPYVVAGDVYSESPHVGRGGWTWYTGAAGWLYRAGVEWMLGFRLKGTALFIDPCIPRNWPGYTIRFRYHSATYQIRVDNPSSVTRGVVMTELGERRFAGVAAIPLADDGALHHVRILLG
ncbi:MAG TPA: glucoamylase family protein [Candidatus Baltobacteraceae bacterium]|nr:glucoamylase family protein [Candidatus Baltobacteraceae bacterium]